MNKKYVTCLLLVIFAVGVNLGLDISFFFNYQDKMDIIEQMLQTDSGGRIDTAVHMLKYGNAAVREGRGILKEYGFTDNLQNIFYKEFIQSCVITGVISIGSLVLIQSAAALYRKRQRAVQEVYFWQLGQCLVQFREDMYQEQYRQFPVLEGYERAVSRINDELERFLEQLAAAREGAYKEKENIKQLVTDISHQLKTPVAALDTCLSVLSEPDLKDVHRQEFETRCKDEIEGLKTLLESLMQVSRLEAGMIQIERTKAPILDTVICAVNRVYPKASEKQIEFSFDYEKDLEDLLVMQDPKWLCEAFINILDNAVKYSPRESGINIVLQRFVSFVRIEVKDQGFGIPRQEYHKIFKRFYRVNDERVQAKNGSGVGLYLTREIIEKHQGTVSVKSVTDSRDTGSRFVVQLPYLK